MYKAISMYGPNIVSAEFDEWKRHRRIAAPSFSEKNNRLVYEETARLTIELFDHWTADENGVVKVDNVVTFTSRLALMVISAAGESYVINTHILISESSHSQALAIDLDGMRWSRHPLDIGWLVMFSILAISALKKIPLRHSKPPSPQYWAILLSVFFLTTTFSGSRGRGAMSSLPSRNFEYVIHQRSRTYLTPTFRFTCVK